MRYLFYLYFLLASGSIAGQQANRVMISLNNDWEFSMESNAYNPMRNTVSMANWQPVRLPHTWNIADVIDDEPGYFRGKGYYRRSLMVERDLDGKDIYLYFEGVNQVADIFINGEKAGHHKGGYTAFYVPVSGLLIPGSKNELIVVADNSHDPAIPPLSADFTFYGGIYRDVWLIAVDPVHFSPGSYGENGVMVSTIAASDAKATIRIRSSVTNGQERDDIKSQIKNSKFHSDSKHFRKPPLKSHLPLRSQSGKVLVNTIIMDADGKTVKKISSTISLKKEKQNQSVEQEISLENPILWSPENPYLYSVVSEIADPKSGVILDRLVNPLGIRWFSFDAEKGFFLNGNSYKLVGASRHQDFKGMGNAVPDSIAINDVLLLKKMGGNFLRVAHYPQDPAVLRACDSLGILASVEIPIVNEITESAEFFQHCREMQTEMIRQHYNHPSVIIWCYMNEVLLRPKYVNDKEKQQIYFGSITRLAKELDSMTRSEDPYRYTMMAHHGDFEKYMKAELIDIPMLVGWNLYSGWYGARLQDFPSFLDTFHKKYPFKPLLVAEYGADADPRIRSNHPERFDKSVEYATSFHQYYLAEMNRRPFVAGAIVWNLADFNSETRTESMPHINNKGLLNWDRSIKDPYYYYQAMLLKTGFIKTLGEADVAAIADSTGKGGLQKLKVAANTESVELFINGKLIGKQLPVNGICEWVISLKDGANEIEVKGMFKEKVYQDKVSIRMLVQTNLFSNNSIPFRQLNILLGANRFFTDDQQQVWIPDQEYRPGSWGYVGGRDFKLANNNRLPYGTDKNITGTPNDPVYQTQRIGIRQYKLDLPPGEYEVELHFAELLGGQVNESAHNLSGTDRIEPNGNRSFDVFINGGLVLEKLNLADQYGVATAVTKSFRFLITDSKGIEINFSPIEGEPVLNAIRVRLLGSLRVVETNAGE